MSVAEMMLLLKDAPGNGYQWAGSTWSGDPSHRGKCELVPPDSTIGCDRECTYPGGDVKGGTLTGSDCSGLVGKAWQLGGPQPIEQPMSIHYRASDFTKPANDWNVIALDDLQQGDAVSSGGHVMFFDRMNDDKYIWYEAQDCKHGIVHGSRRKFDTSKWVASRRKDVIAARECSETTCSSHGECAQGLCTCQDGYTGTDCAQCSAGFVGYPTCHVPAEQCVPQGELRCGNKVTVTPSQGSSRLASYDCEVANSAGPELVYQFRPTSSGRATVRLEGGGSLAVLRDTCAAEACIASDTQQVVFDYARGLTAFVAVESAGASGDVTLSIECDTGPWIGDPCSDDSGCKMNKADGTPLTGFCSKLEGESVGFCSLDCTNTNGCPDLLTVKAPTACIATSKDPTRGMCVATQSNLNRYCDSVPGTTKQSIPKFKRSEVTAQVCAPRPEGVPACQGSIGGRILDATTGAPIQGGQISTVGDSSHSAVTNDRGEYLIPGVPCQTLSLTFGAAGYASAAAFATTTKDTETAVSDIMLTPESGCAKSTMVRGFVTDGAAEESKAVPGATVELRRGVDARQGEIVKSVTTDSDGAFSVADLSPGSYTATVLANRFSSSWTNQVACDEVSDAGNVSIVPQQDQAVMRIALRWSAPPDLDLHVQLPNGEEVYYRDECRGALNTPPYATLDIDREVTVGPEVVSIYRYMPGTYTVFVHNFSQQVRTIFFGEDDPAIHDVSFASASASVAVYGPDGKELAHFTPPAGSGYFWDVFSFDGGASGAISRLQRLTNEHKNPDTEYSEEHCGP